MSGPFGTDDEETIVKGAASAAPGRSPEPAADSASGRFEMLGLLGEGGMATVAEARDTRLGRVVALKRLKPVHAHDADLRERFAREARILGGMAHPGLVPVYEAGRLAEDDLYIAMQKVRGKTLTDIMRGRHDAQVRDRAAMLHLVDIFERICLAIAYAHGQRIIHRDLKPSNVMVDDEFGVVYVMDWGLSKRLAAPGAPPAEPTTAGVVMGTPGYMAPEQAQGLAADDTRTDVFALGVILYEILTGRRPFQGDGLLDLLKETAHHDPPPPVTINKRCGRALSAVCMKALAKDPKQRYPSAREMAEDIRRFREFLPVSVEKPRLIERTVNWARRNRAVSGATAAALAALLGFGIYSGINAYTRMKTVAWVMEQVDAKRQSIREIERQIDAVKARIAVISDPVERRALQETDLSELRGDLLARHLELRGQLAAVIGYTFPRPHPRAVKMAREQVLYLARRGIATGEYHMAAALLASALEGYEDRNFLGFTEAQAAELKDLLARAHERARQDQEAAFDDGPSFDPAEP